MLIILINRLDSCVREEKSESKRFKKYPRKIYNKTEIRLKFRRQQFCQDFGQARGGIYTGAAAKEQSPFLRPQYLCSADGSSWPYKVMHPVTTLLLFGAKNV